MLAKVKRQSIWASNHQRLNGLMYGAVSEFGVFYEYSKFLDSIIGQSTDKLDCSGQTNLQRCTDVRLFIYVFIPDGSQHGWEDTMGLYI